MEDLGILIRDYMPILFNYLEELVAKGATSAPSLAKDPTESAEYIDFLTKVEQFTRTCTHYDENEVDNPVESIPMTENDMFAVFCGSS
jgi:hypothetical protein